MQVKNVVIINDFNFIQGGASKVAIDTAKILAQNGINVYFFSAVNKEEEKIDGITYISTNQNEALKEKNKLKGILNGIYNVKAKKELKKLLLTLDKSNTIIHVHGWTKALSSSVFDIAFKMNFKIVLTLHDYFVACPNGGFFDYKKNKACAKKQLSPKCIFCNCDSRNYLFKLYRIIRQFVQTKIVKLNKKIEYVVSISDFSKHILKDAFNKNVKFYKIYNPTEFLSNKRVEVENNDIYLYVGRISKEKGVDIFCEVAESLNLKAIVVGDGNERENLEKKYKKIRFVGWKNKLELQEYMNIAKCLVFSSRWYETAGLTAIEANQQGIPVIVPTKTATIEFVDKKYNLVFENSNVESLKEKIIQYEKYGKEKIKKISEEIINKTHENEKYGINYYENLIKLYNDMLKIKCLHILSGLVSGGVEAMVYNYLTNEDWDDFEFEFITHGKSIEKCKKQFEELGIKIYTVTPKKESFIENIKQINSVMKRKKYDIVHSHMSWYNFIPLAIAKKNRIKVRINHSHLYLEDLSFIKKIYFKILSFLNIITANVYFSCSDKAGKFLFAKKKYYIINNGIDVDKYKFNKEMRNKQRQKLNLGNELCIGHIGRFFEQKNHKYLLEIFKQYLKIDKRAKLLLIGDGDLKEEIKNKTKEMGISDRVIFLGAIDNVYEVINAIDIFVFPSQYEGFGIVLIEAQGNGIFSISSKNVPIETKISENIKYIDIKNENIDEWVETICENKNNTIKREEQYKNIEKAKFDIKENAKQLIILYKEMYNGENL